MGVWDGGNCFYRCVLPWVIGSQWCVARAREGDGVAKPTI